MNSYELRLDQFFGPLDKLLELIEERQMEITELSLAEITADFLQYLKTQIDTDKNPEGEPSVSCGAGTDKHGYISPRVIADFVAVAAQLLLIKSKALLPGIKLTSEEEEKIKDLEGRLLFYKNFKPAIIYLKQLSENKKVSISRPLFSGRQSFFYPSENIKIEELYKAVRMIFESLAEIPEKQTIKLSLITLEEKVEEIMKRLGKFQVRPSGDFSKTSFNFQELSAEKSRSEIIVMFLAVLHLLANQLIKIEQKNRFEEIMIMNKEL